MDNLTDSQRNLLRAIRREVEDVVNENILREIQALREEVDRMRKTENDRLRRVVVRIANSLLALVGRDEKG